MLLWGLKDEKGRLVSKEGVPMLFKTKVWANKYYMSCIPQGIECKMVRVVVEELVGG